MNITVIGAGSWGTAVAGVLGGKGHDVVLWARRDDIVQSINTDHKNPDYLVTYTLPLTVVSTSDPKTAVENSEAIVFVTPSHALRSTAKLFKPFVPDDLPIVVLTKGVEPHTNMMMTDVVGDVLGNTARIAGLSGPNHAEEVSKNMPAAAVVAAQDEKIANFFQEAFHTTTFRVYTSDDVVGVELSAASKNIVAIAVGISYGIGFGENTAAVLMTRGLAEMARLVVTMGGQPLTCMGLAGMGDLIATCTSKHSRNRMFGESFAHGTTLDEYEKERHMVVEGAKAAHSVLELAERHDVDAPITRGVHRLLQGEITIEEAMDSLITRDPNTEFYGYREFLEE